jgi:hypothetical protein
MRPVHAALCEVYADLGCRGLQDALRRLSCCGTGTIAQRSMLPQHCCNSRDAATQIWDAEDCKKLFTVQLPQIDLTDQREPRRAVPVESIKAPAPRASHAVGSPVWHDTLQHSAPRWSTLQHSAYTVHGATHVLVAWVARVCEYPGVPSVLWPLPPVVAAQH